MEHNCCRKKIMRDGNPSHGRLKWWQRMKTIRRKKERENVFFVDVYSPVLKDLYRRRTYRGTKRFALVLTMRQNFRYKISPLWCAAETVMCASVAFCCQHRLSRTESRVTMKKGSKSEYSRNAAIPSKNVLTCQNVLSRII